MKRYSPVFDQFLQPAKNSNKNTPPLLTVGTCTRSPQKNQRLNHSRALETSLSQCSSRSACFLNSCNRMSQETTTSIVQTSNTQTSTPATPHIAGSRVGEALISYPESVGGDELRRKSRRAQLLPWLRSSLLG